VERSGEDMREGPRRAERRAEEMTLVGTVNEHNFLI
jgi:hypothetical protein